MKRVSLLTEAETLAVADEQPGRRNWSKCRVVTDVTNTQTHLFLGDCLTQAAVNKLSPNELPAMPPAIASSIAELIQ